MHEPNRIFRCVVCLFDCLIEDFKVFLLGEARHLTNILKILSRFSSASPPLRVTCTGPSHSFRSAINARHWASVGLSSWPRFFHMSQWIHRALQRSVKSRTIEVGRQ